MYDLGIIGGLVYIGKTFHRINVYIKDEKIQALSMTKLSCKKEVDASGRYVLPGFIDPHVHFSLGNDPNRSKDDFYAGSKEAVLGGVTTYIDFLDPIQKVEELETAYKERLALAKESLVDFGFHLTLRDPLSPAEEIISSAKALGMPSIKLFTTYQDTKRRTFDQQIYELLKVSKTQKIWIVVHAENDELICHDKDILVKDHEKARPMITEQMEVMKLATMARETKGNLYIVHVSAGSTVDLLKQAFSKELARRQIVLESCPHYFLLNNEAFQREDGYKFTMTPPLRSEAERKLLIENINHITTIGTDHCPFTKEQKQHPYTSQIPMGIGGIRYSFLNMYGLYGFDVIDQFTQSVADVYSLEGKGQLLPGFDGDVVIFDLEGKTKVEDEMSVYNGKVFDGAIETVVARGTVVLENGKIYPHKGRYIERGECDERN